MSEYDEITNRLKNVTLDLEMFSLSRALTTLKKVLKEVDKEHLFYQIAGSKDRSAFRDNIGIAFKSLVSELDDEQLGLFRQLKEAIAQIDDEELREYLEEIVDSLLSEEEKTKNMSVMERMAHKASNPGARLRIDLNNERKPTNKPFDWGKIRNPLRRRKSVFSFNRMRSK